MRTSLHPAQSSDKRIHGKATPPIMGDSGLRQSPPDPSFSVLPDLGSFDPYQDEDKPVDYVGTFDTPNPGVGLLSPERLEEIQADYRERTPTFSFRSSWPKDQ